MPCVRTTSSCPWTSTNFGRCRASLRPCPRSRSSATWHPRPSRRGSSNRTWNIWRSWQGQRPWSGQRLGSGIGMMGMSWAWFFSGWVEWDVGAGDSSPVCSFKSSCEKSSEICRTPSPSRVKQSGHRFCRFLLALGGCWSTLETQKTWRKSPRFATHIAGIDHHYSPLIDQIWIAIINGINGII